MQINEILNQITKSKRSQGALVNYAIAQDQIIGNRVGTCGSWLHLRQFTEVEESRIMNANFCRKFLLCQSCAVRRSAKMNAAYLEKVTHVQTTFPKLIPAMITLTIKNGSDLKERINHLKKSWSRMLAAKRKGASESSRNPLIEWNKLHGSIRAMEITISKNGEWHPHLHVFCLLESYVNHKRLSEEWEAFTGDSKIVDVRKCKDGVKAGLVEVLKYATKFSDLTPAETWHVHESCRGSRLIDPQGCLRGVQIPDIESDDLIGCYGSYIDFIASWLWTEKKYKLTKIDECTIPF